MDAINTQETWDEALERLLLLFESMDLAGIEHRHRTALQLIEHARQRFNPDLGLSTTEVTMDVVGESLEGWFTKALGESADRVRNRTAAGLLAWRVTGGSQRWGDVLLAGDPPADLRRAFESVRAQTGPDLAFSSMTHREMDYGPMESIAQETWHRFAWAPLLTAVIFWTAIFFLALAIHDHFFLP